MKKVMKTLSPIALLLLTTAVFAAEDNHASHDTTHPMTQSYIKAMDDMHKPMMEGIMSSDPDVAFVAGMIAHHQGAIDMAKIELKYGQDPEIKALAEQVIKAQTQEIAFMKKWLDDHLNKSTTTN